MTAKPNILFFFTDDQRFDTIGALGGPVRTPHLDALVARGTAFTRAHIPGGTSGAVCMPSRAMLHSGRTLFHIDREGQEIPEAHITMGQCFRAAGYDTIGIGKWHNGEQAYARSFSHGDEIFFGGMADHWNVPAHHFDPTGKYDQRCPFIADPLYSNVMKQRDCDHIHAGVHSTDLFADTAIRFINERDGATPFFMYVSLMAPHDPRSMPKRFLDLYDPATIPLPANFLPEHPIDTGALKIRDEVLAAFPRDPAEIRRHIAEYYAMISHLDDAFGRIMAALDAAGLLDSTIIVMSGDNGLAVGQHGLMGKQSVYDHSVRVPLVFAGPGIPRGGRCDSLAYLLDIYPTLCDIAGIAVPSSVEGLSLLPSIAHSASRHRDDLYLAYTDSIRGVTDGTHKLIEYACGATQLFDLVADPTETRNLAAVPSSGPVIARLRGRLAALAAASDDERHPLGTAFWSARADLKPRAHT